jgi:hypothetical protein
MSSARKNRSSGAVRLARLPQAWKGREQWGPGRLAAGLPSPGRSLKCGWFPVRKPRPHNSFSASTRRAVRLAAP